MLVKISCALLLCLMLLFAAVQFNDPDGLLWAAVYAVPASAMLVALVRPGWLGTVAGRIALGAALAGLGIATLLAWPEQAGFWRREVWWREESAREGMGLGVAFLVTSVALAVVRPARRRGPAVPVPVRDPMRRPAHPS